MTVALGPKTRTIRTKGRRFWPAAALLLTFAATALAIAAVLSHFPDGVSVLICLGLDLGLLGLTVLAPISSDRNRSSQPKLMMRQLTTAKFEVQASGPVAAGIFALHGTPTALDQTA